MPLRSSIFDLEDGFNNFFAKRSGYPRFKSKFSRQSYRTSCVRSTYKGKEHSNIEVDLLNRFIKLPKLGKVKIRGFRNKDKIEGKIYYKINTYYPSSQICSHCGYENSKLKDLSIREYNCPNCGSYNDRDINASLNILFVGLKLHYNLVSLV